MNTLGSRTVIFDRQMKDERDYWLAKLSGGVEHSGLRPDLPRPVGHWGRTGAVEVSLSSDTFQRLMKLTGGKPFLLYAALMAGLKVCLHKYTGSASIAVGSPALSDSDGHGLGNVLVIIDQVTDELSFRELLLNVRRNLLEAYGRQRYPFDYLLRDLGLEGAQGSALFDVALVMEGIHCDMREVANDITIAFRRGSTELAGSVTFDEGVFRRDSIERLARHFVNVLRAGLENINAPIAELQMLSGEERHRSLVEWNDCRAEYPQDRCIHELFEAQAARTPDVVAAVLGGQHLTYRELNRRANRLAQLLRQRGVGADDLVLICMERSLEMMVGLLGILKAGGAYVPASPGDPVERLTLMLRDTQAKVLLTQESLLSRLPQHELDAICLDVGWDDIGCRDEANVPGGAAPDNLAYVLYTSGSTGLPKGCMVAHRSVVNHSTALAGRYGLRLGDRVLQFASLTFDVVVEEIFPSWFSGSTVVLMSQEMLAPDIEFVRLLEREAVTVVNQAASHWHAWVQALADWAMEVPACLRLVVLGVERVLPELYAVWLRLGGSRVCWMNAYGTTETTVSSILYDEVSFPSQSPSLEIPVGRPIANTQAFLLDSHLQPVPVGGVGELYIGGLCLARGYLNGPALTAERFIPSPYGNQPGARLYRTGDLARYLPDGNIEFLGRIDYQVKVRGHRIELEEIEAALCQHPAVKETVVVTVERKPGDRRLVAYVVAAASEESTSTALRQFLQQKLPAYMVPSAFVALDALPLTPAGKVDRQALPAPEVDGLEPAGLYTPPRTAVEERLAAIWAQILGLERVGVHDNFFELGGDSILSIQIIARARQAGIRLSLPQLFEQQTIAELATVAEVATAVEAEHGLITGPVPLTPIQCWFFTLSPIDPHHFNQAILLEMRERLSLGGLAEALRQLLLHHDALRLRFERTATGWQQLNAAMDGAVPFTQIDLSALPEEQHAVSVDAAAAALQASLDLSAGPILRAALFDRGGAGPDRLFIVVHQLVLDGVSWRILLEDLEMAYWQLSRGESVALPAKTTSFKQWAERLTKHAQGDDVQRELSYWLREQRRSVSPLPLDHASDANTVASIRTVSVFLSGDETEALLRKAPKAYRAQVHEVLLTALALAFAQWTGEDLLLVDVEGHGREAPFEGIDLSRTVGWFTSLYPLLLELKDMHDPEESVRSTKEQLRQIPHKGLNYGVLRYLNRGTSAAARLQALPQAQVIFSYLGQLDQALLGASLFGLAQEASGETRSARGKRRYLLEINGSIMAGQLQMTWAYSQNVHDRSTIERLAQTFLQALRALIAHSQSPEVQGFAPSDFPAARLSQAELDKFLGASRSQG